MSEQTPSGLHLPDGAGAQARTSDREAAREVVRSFDGLGPWGGTVTVTAVAMRGRLSGRLGPGRTFEVTATWTGPPMAADAAPESEREAHAFRQDSVWITDHDIAIAAAAEAARRLRAPYVPDLRAIETHVKRLR